MRYITGKDIDAEDRGCEYSYVPVVSMPEGADVINQLTVINSREKPNMVCIDLHVKHSVLVSATMNRIWDVLAICRVSIPSVMWGINMDWADHFIRERTPINGWLQAITPYSDYLWVDIPWQFVEVGENMSLIMQLLDWLPPAPKLCVINPIRIDSLVVFEALVGCLEGLGCTVCIRTDDDVRSIEYLKILLENIPNG